MGKFVIRKTATGFVFHLQANNGETVAVSEVYTTQASCIKGIKSVKTNAKVAKTEDQTVEGYPIATNPKFEVYCDKAGQYRFRLKARNGKIIAASEGYSAKASCQNGISSVCSNAVGAKIVKEKQ